MYNNNITFKQFDDDNNSSFSIPLNIDNSVDSSSLISSNIDEYNREISIKNSTSIAIIDKLELKSIENFLCSKCRSYIPKKELFLYKEQDFICLKCSVKVKRIDLSDWEEKHKKGKGIIKCVHCHGKKSIDRYPIQKKTNKRRKTCDYCSLVFKLNGIIKKNQM